MGKSDISNQKMMDKTRRQWVKTFKNFYIKTRSKKSNFAQMPDIWNRIFFINFQDFVDMENNAIDILKQKMKQPLTENEIADEIKNLLNQKSSDLQKKLNLFNSNLVSELKKMFKLVDRISKEYTPEIRSPV